MITINKFRNLTTTGTTGPATLSNGILNIPNYSSGGSSDFIPAIKSNEIRRGLISINNTTTVGTFGGYTPIQTGSAFATLLSGSTLVKYPRIRIYTIGGATNSTAGIEFGSNSLVNCIQSGFKFIGSYIYSDQSTGGTNWFVPGARQFCGLASVGTILNISSSVTVESQINIIGIGSDTADVNLQIFHNDATGLATKIDLGSNFPANKLSAVANNECYSLELYNEIYTNTVKYRVTRLSDGINTTGTITTNLPSISTLLSPQVVRTSGTTSQNVSIDVLQLTIYSND